MIIFDNPPNLILPEYYEAKHPAIIRPDVDIASYMPVEFDKKTRRAIIKELKKLNALNNRFEVNKLIEAAIPFGAFASVRPITIVTTATTDLAGGSNIGTHTVNMPSSIAAGNLLVAFCCTQGSKTSLTSSGWTVSGNVATGTANADRRIYMLTKTATGSEGATINFSMSPTGLGAWFVLQIKNHNGIYFSTGATGTTSTPNPPSLAPAPGLGTYLWFALAGSRQSSYTAGPGGTYGAVTQLRTGSSTGVLLGVATKVEDLASSDPGSFTLIGAGTWVAATAAIKQA